MTSEPAAVGDAGLPLFCYRHPSRETYVRCGRCDRPICPACAMQGPVGFRCRTCGTPARDPLTHLTPTQFGTAAATALAAGTVGGFVGLQIGMLFALCIGPFIGGFIGEAVMRVTGYKRGPVIRLIVVGGVLGGVLAAAAVQYVTFVGNLGVEDFPIATYVAGAALGAAVYVVAALFGAFTRLR